MTASSDLVVQTEQLSKIFRVGFWGKKVTAVDGVNMEVRRGEVFGFLGPNGAGKTTTLKMLMGLIYPTSGHARLFGQNLGDPQTKARLGFLPESPYFYDYLTSREFLGFYGHLFGLWGAVLDKRIDELLELVGMTHAKDLQLRKFSKGMLQRVGVAQALINDPELVVLDEPMSGLDPIGRKEVRDLILRLRDRGCTVFFSSHVLSDAEALCSRVAILAKGRLVATGRLTDMLAFRARGWELVVAGVNDAALAAVESRVRSAVRIGEGRYMLDLPLEPAPEHLLADLTRAGAHLVSLNPVRQTLEDFFVEQVTAPDVLASSRGLGA